MREIQASTITDVVEKLCIEANYHLPEDVKCAITGCRACEDGEIAKGVLDKIVENYEIADAQNVPICQDTGMACVFLEIGQDVHIAGGDLAEAVNEGVRRGYDKGYLRKSVVKDPVRRGNTGDNTPSISTPSPKKDRLIFALRNISDKFGSLLRFAANDCNKSLSGLKSMTIQSSSDLIFFVISVSITVFPEPLTPVIMQT